MRMSDWSSDVCSSDLRLPGEAGVGIVDQVVGQLAARHADAAADEALQAVIGTEVQQAVQHERQGRSRAAETALVQVDFSALVTGFRFQAETAEVVTDHGVAVEALVVVRAGDRVAGGASVAGGESDVLIFDENNAGVDADIPAIVTRQGRGDRKSTRLNSSH